MAELFRSSLFGYSKKSVIAYVAEMNEDFSQKLLAKDMECRDTVRELKEHSGFTPEPPAEWADMVAFFTP